MEECLYDMEVIDEQSKCLSKPCCWVGTALAYVSEGQCIQAPISWISSFHGVEKTTYIGGVWLQLMFNTVCVTD